MGIDNGGHIHGKEDLLPTPEGQVIGDLPSAELATSADLRRVDGPILFDPPVGTGQESVVKSIYCFVVAGLIANLERTAKTQKRTAFR